jgi:multiple sugar transport system permease protein/raffinose/stachyose/melibiose transport system permease protein
VDGASLTKQFFRITIPMLRPITFFLFVMSSIKAFQVFDQIYVMTRGGPVKATTTIAYEIYEEGFTHLKMGYASAMSVILLIIVAIITFINFTYGREGYGEQL